MSQSEDLEAINDYFKRTAAVNNQAAALKSEWNTWWNGLGYWAKTFDGNTMSAARARRIAFNQANGAPERVRPPAELLTKEEADYWQKAGVNVTNMTPEEKHIAANTVKPGLKVPASLKPYINTNGPATVATGVAGYSTISRAKGAANNKEDVKRWQGIIGVTVDGVFGSGTDAATRKWQTTWNERNPADKIVVDGVVGPNTWRRALVPTNSAAVEKPSVLASLNPFSKPPTAPPVVPVPNRPVVTKPTPTAKPAAKSAAQPVAASKPSSATPAPSPGAMAVSAIPGKSVVQWFKSLPTWAYIAGAGAAVLTIVGGTAAIASDSEPPRRSKRR